MITLVRDGIVMQVASELQASVFERNGYVRVADGTTEGRDNAGEQETVAPATQPAKASEKVTLDEQPAKEEKPVEADPAPEKPKRRRRRKTDTE